MHLDRTWIESNIPHKGRMCLLDEVIEWDALRIRCRSVAMCMYIHEMTRGPQAPANGSADAAAAASHQSPSRRLVHFVIRSLASKTTVARPLNNFRASAVTVNSYSALP